MTRSAERQPFGTPDTDTDRAPPGAGEWQRVRPDPGGARAGAGDALTQETQGLSSDRRPLMHTFPVVVLFRKPTGATAPSDFEKHHFIIDIGP